jgi:hypothetical protein
MTGYDALVGGLGGTAIVILSALGLHLYADLIANEVEIRVRKILKEFKEERRD